MASIVSVFMLTDQPHCQRKVFILSWRCQQCSFLFKTVSWSSIDRSSIIKQWNPKILTNWKNKTFTDYPLSVMNYVNYVLTGCNHSFMLDKLQWSLLKLCVSSHIVNNSGICPVSAFNSNLKPLPLWIRMAPPSPFKSFLSSFGCRTLFVRTSFLVHTQTATQKLVHHKLLHHKLLHHKLPRHKLVLL